jgi:CheY-like chemotaxis protein
VAYSGQSALETAALYLPDVVLLDIGLPEIDGYEVARRLRQDPKTKHVLLIAVSGYGQGTDRERSRDAGFDAHMVKPVDPEEIQRILASRAQGQME